MNLIKKCIAEFIGTFVLVLFGCGTAVVTQCSTNNYPGYLLTALAFGLAIVAMAYSIGNISGCHVNPAVSVACFVAGRMDAKELAGYCVSQFLGAIAGGGVLSLLVDKSTGFGTNSLFNGNVLSTGLIEAILTAVFVYVILEVTSKQEFQSIAGLVIGLTLTFVHIFGIYFTGTSVNPARSLGPALFAGGSALSVVPVFICAPIIGGCLAAVLFKIFHTKKF